MQNFVEFRNLFLKFLFDDVVSQNYFSWMFDVLNVTACVLDFVDSFFFRESLNNKIVSFISIFVFAIVGQFIDSVAGFRFAIAACLLFRTTDFCVVIALSTALTKFAICWTFHRSGLVLLPAVSTFFRFGFSIVQNSNCTSL